MFYLKLLTSTSDITGIATNMKIFRSSIANTLGTETYFQITPNYTFSITDRHIFWWFTLYTYASFNNVALVLFIFTFLTSLKYVFPKLNSKTISLILLWTLLPYLLDIFVKGAYELFVKEMNSIQKTEVFTLWL